MNRLRVEASAMVNLCLLLWLLATCASQIRGQASSSSTLAPAIQQQPQLALNSPVSAPSSTSNPSSAGQQQAKDTLNQQQAGRSQAPATNSGALNSSLISANSLTPATSQQSNSIKSAAFESANQQASFAPRTLNQLHQQQQQMPNITIYISRNEIRKLLGIDTEIYYIQQGHVKPYPLAFAIPLGYNQSDIIFTWQNLGPLPVNYSISLSFGKEAVIGDPLINILRAGALPKHEQVFKITVPCSGKLSAEVDVQVLIHLSWLQPLDSSVAGAAPGDQLDDARHMSHTLTVRRKKICTQQAQLVAGQPRHTQPAQTTQAPPQPKRPLFPPGFRPHQSSDASPMMNPVANNNNNPYGSKAASYYADQAEPDLNGPSPTINQRNFPDEPTFSVPQPGPLIHNANGGPNQRSVDGLAARMNDQSARPQKQQDFNSVAGLDLNEPPPNLIKSLATPMPPLTPIPMDNPLNKWVRPPQSQPELQQAREQQLAQSPTSSPLVMIALGVSMFVVIALIVILLVGFASNASHASSAAASGIAAGFSRDSSLKKYPLNSIGRLSSIRSWIAKRSHSNSGSSRSSSSTSAGHHQGGLGAFGATFGVISAGTIRGANNHHQHHLQQHSMRANKSNNVIIGDAGFNFHSTNKLSESGLSALSNNNHHSTTLIRGLSQTNYPSSTKQQQQQLNSPSADNQNSFHCSYYGTNSLYSHPPTADLLGTGYQASSGGYHAHLNQQHAQPTSFHQPGNMYHPLTTAANNGQTTRLVWQPQAPNDRLDQQHLNSNEAGYFMPLSQTGRSETGSLYQTID